MKSDPRFGRLDAVIARLGLGLGFAVGPAVLPGMALGMLFGVACVSSELNAMKEAEARFDHCVIEHSESHAECESLRADYLEAQRRYEENSRRAWSCDPATEECPTPR